MTKAESIKAGKTTKDRNPSGKGLEGTNIIAFGRGKVILCHGEDTEYDPDSFVDWLRVDKAWTVRNWGTEWGLGQLSTSGPTSETILDAIPHGLRVPIAAIHGLWTCTDQSIKAFKPVCDESDKKLLK